MTNTHLQVNIQFFLMFNILDIRHILVALSFDLDMIELKVKELVAQSCWTVCDPMDCSLSGSSVHGALQARMLEWVAIPFFRGSLQPRDQT